MDMATINLELELMRTTAILNEGLLIYKKFEIQYLEEIIF